MTRIERMKIEFTDAKDSGRDELGPLHSHVAIEIQLALDLLTLVEKQHEALGKVVSEYDDRRVGMDTYGIHLSREALTAFDQFNQEEG